MSDLRNRCIGFNKISCGQMFCLKLRKNIKSPTLAFKINIHLCLVVTYFTLSGHQNNWSSLDELIYRLLRLVHMLLKCNYIYHLFGRSH